MQPNYYPTFVLRQSVIPIQKTVDKRVWVQTIPLRICYQEKSLIWAFCVSEGICQRDTQCACTRNIGSISRNLCRRGKVISSSYSDTVSVALGIQHTMYMTRILFTSVICPAVPHFSTLSQTALLSGWKVIGNKMCVSIFSRKLCKAFLVLWRVDRDVS